MTTNSLFIDVKGCALVGMVHLLPLPGSPGWQGSMQAVLEAAKRDAGALLEGGCDALLVENMGDVPYLKGTVAPETLAAMTMAVASVVPLGAPVGVQILAAANLQAMAVASVTGASFVRVEAFAYAHVADEGWIDASAGPLLRMRSRLHASVSIWADVHKKHSAHAVTGDLSLDALAHGAAFCGADALIATGAATGQPTREADLKQIATAGLPVVVGSGVTIHNAATMSQHADALIVGSWLKEEGDWRRPVSVARVAQLRTILTG